MKRWSLLLLAVALALATTATGKKRGKVAVKSVAREFNPTQEEYEVVRGDTLWDISKKIVGDPYAWPRVWSLNPEITNPHWIYPGDHVRFYEPNLELPSQADLVAGNMGLPEDGGEGKDVDSIEGPDAAEVAKSDVPAVESVGAPIALGGRSGASYRYLERFITAKELQQDGVLTNAVPDKILLAPGDRVYLRFPSGKRPAAGKRLLSYRTLAEVVHPTAGGRQGFLTQVTGILVVEPPGKDKADADITRARVVEAIFEIERGNNVTIHDQDLKVRLVHVPATKQVKGIILALRTGPDQMAGDFDLVFIDRGKQHGIERGNRLRILNEKDAFAEGGAGKLREDIGLLQVIDARDTSSTCMVLSSQREIEPGAEVETLVSGTTSVAAANPAPAPTPAPATR
jgi:hypothetical protein